MKSRKDLYELVIAVLVFIAALVVLFIVLAMPETRSEVTLTRMVFQFSAGAFMAIAVAVGELIIICFSERYWPDEEDGCVTKEKED